MNTTTLEAFKRLRELLAGTDKTTQTILRILAAVFGGYALTSSVLAALLLRWAFGAFTAQRAWRNKVAEASKGSIEMKKSAECIILRIFHLYMVNRTASKYCVI
ncbi:hypothetical protein [Pelosinus fermentans]|uniref:Uncharacterized protein n=1 Tax=Pelosinus fermentans JBW45 TaxID=1192197 RepID=I9DEU6_9FIRM|nr:hypothetical protein [Pelosinus fermentans]AJQ28697.1 hypothetical protein JBW_03356 [Pelosinus fermentans JBW45]